MIRRTARVFITFSGVALVTWIGSSLARVNATTVGFAYLLLVLVLATIWGFWEACIASIAATLTFNLFFLPPVGKFTIADPQNWVALFSFMATALVASRLSARAKRRALDALSRQQELERLYVFSRAILLIEQTALFPKQMVQQLANIFGFGAVVLYDRRAGEFHRAGPSDIEDLDGQIRATALQGTMFADAEQFRIVTAVRLGSEPIAALALQGVQMSDPVVQAIANLTAIGLERARAQEMSAQVEAARQSEKLRRALIDAMAHEFKTPLTSVIGVTTALLDNPNQSPLSRLELLRVADQEAHHLKQLIDDTVEMARLDATDIRVHAEPTDIRSLVQEVVSGLAADIDNRPVQILADGHSVLSAVDRRLIELAVKQLLDNALKYTTSETPITITVHDGADSVRVGVTDCGAGIPAQEQDRIFERWYRSPSVEHQIPGSGLGLNIALHIARAHGGDLTVISRPGETTFQLTLPVQAEGAVK